LFGEAASSQVVNYFHLLALEATLLQTWLPSLTHYNCVQRCLVQRF
jgi:hypothetical protein